MQTADYRLRRLLAAFALAAAVLSACSVPPEQSILDEFFAAARLRDNTALARLATVTFEPLERGIVEKFDITAVTPERPDGSGKDVTVTAQVKERDGRVEPQTLVVTLRHVIVEGDPESERRWKVTAVERPAGR